MARDVVELAEIRRALATARRNRQDVEYAYMHLLLDVADAAKLVSEGEGFSVHDHSQTLADALARLYAGSSGECD